MLRHILTAAELSELGLDDRATDNTSLTAEKRLRFFQFLEVRRFLMLHFTWSWATCAAAIWMYWRWTAEPFVEQSDARFAEATSWELVAPPAVLFYAFVAVCLIASWAEVATARRLLDPGDSWASWDILGLGLGLLGRGTVYCDALFLVFAHRLGHPLVGLAGLIITSLGYVWLVMGHQARMLLALFSLKDDYSSDKPNRFFHIAVVTDSCCLRASRRRASSDGTTVGRADYWQLLFGDEAAAVQSNSARVDARNPVVRSNGSYNNDNPTMATPVLLVMRWGCRLFENAWSTLLSAAQIPLRRRTGPPGDNLSFGMSAGMCENSRPSPPLGETKPMDVTPASPFELSDPPTVELESTAGDNAHRQPVIGFEVSPGPQLPEHDAAPPPNWRRPDRRTAQVAVARTISAGRTWGPKKSSSSVRGLGSRLRIVPGDWSASGRSSSSSSRTGGTGFCSRRHRNDAASRGDFVELAPPPPRGHWYTFCPSYALSLWVSWGCQVLATTWASSWAAVGRRAGPQHQVPGSSRCRPGDARSRSATKGFGVAASTTTTATALERIDTAACDDGALPHAIPLARRHAGMLHFITPLIPLGLCNRSTTTESVAAGSPKIEPAPFAPDLPVCNSVDGFSPGGGGLRGEPLQDGTSQPQRTARGLCEAPTTATAAASRWATTSSWSSNATGSSNTKNSGTTKLEGTPRTPRHGVIGDPNNSNSITAATTTTYDNNSNLGKNSISNRGTIVQTGRSGSGKSEKDPSNKCNDFYKNSSGDYYDFRCENSGNQNDNEDHSCNGGDKPLIVSSDGAERGMVIIVDHASAGPGDAESGEYSNRDPQACSSNCATSWGPLSVMKAWIDNFERVQRRVIVPDSKVQQLANLSYSLNAEMIHSVLSRAFVPPDFLESHEFSAALSATMRCFLEDVLLGVLKVYVLISSHWPPFVLATLVLSVVQASAACLRNTVDTDLWTELLAAD